MGVRSFTKAHARSAEIGLFATLVIPSRCSPDKKSCSSINLTLLIPNTGISKPKPSISCFKLANLLHLYKLLTILTLTQRTSCLLNLFMTSSSAIPTLTFNIYIQYILSKKRHQSCFHLEEMHFL